MQADGPDGRVIEVGEVGSAVGPCPDLAGDVEAGDGARDDRVRGRVFLALGELRGTGITVFALSPGATGTEFNAIVGTDDATAGARMRTPDQVVATALAHLERHHRGPSVIDGRSNRVAALVGRLSATA